MRHHSHPFVYPGDWVEQAACDIKQGEKHYPPDDKPVPRDFYAKAKTVCQQCCVVEQCFRYGENETYGVWGMTTPVERHRMRERKARYRTLIEDPLQQEAVGE